MILQRYLARITRIREYFQESYKNGVIVQVQKNLEVFLNLARKRLIYLTDISCEKNEQNRSLLQESSKIFHFLQDSCNFVQE